MNKAYMNGWTWGTQKAIEEGNLGHERHAVSYARLLMQSLLRSEARGDFKAAECARGHADAVLSALGY